MKVKLNTHEGNTKQVDNIRKEILSCADGIIDYISEQMIMPRVYDDFGHDLDVHDAERLANIVYNQIKIRM
jgi:hypothetical protein